ncbi:MAG: CHRD domain-containing protein [Bacteroidota bacterium]
MRRLLSVLLVLGLAYVAPRMITAQTHFTATLSGAQENPPVTTTASGTGAFTLNDTWTELRYVITYRGLSGTITGGHFHTGAVGSNGPVVRNIATSGDPASTTTVGSWKSTDATQPLTLALVDSLLTGRAYVNFHTAANPGGEMRGQVNLAVGIQFTASLTGAQENPPVSTTASGTGAFTLNAARTALTYNITYRGLSGTLTGGHFHTGAVGVNGPVVRNIASVGDPASATTLGTWQSTDATQPLTPALVDSLIAGRVYVNFHTSANAGGEMRGQLNMTGGTGFTASLSGAQENPAVTTGASGTGSFSLNSQRTELQYNITYIGMSGTLTGGHFHTGITGVNGPVVRGITANGDPASATISGTWRTTDATQPFTPALAESLLTGKLYVNFHTAANPGGENRGQINLSTGVGYIARLNGAQENPPVSTTASGAGSIVLDASRTSVKYDVTYIGLSGTLTGGHFHTGAVGRNGAVVRNIVTVGDPASATIGGTWATSDATQPLTAALVDSLIAGKIYVNFHTAANAGGEIRGQVTFGTDIVTSVEKTSNVIPSEFNLQQNYPNPFNPSTAISFDLAKTARVSLKVYNVLGQLVATLLDDVKQPGSYKISFNAATLGSGMYFYRLLTDAGFSETRKMLLLK